MLPPFVTTVITRAVFVTERPLLSNGAALSSVSRLRLRKGRSHRKPAGKPEAPLHVTTCPESAGRPSSGAGWEGASRGVACVPRLRASRWAGCCSRCAVLSSDLQRVTTPCVVCLSSPRCLHSGKLMTRRQPRRWEGGQPRREAAELCQVPRGLRQRGALPLCLGVWRELCLTRSWQPWAFVRG